MSSPNLVLSVVQKLRSPYFTTAMQKRNARKILKVRSPHCSTVFASMMWSLPPHHVWFCSKYPSFSYIQSTHRSQELFLKAIHFLEPLAHKNTTLNNVVILFQKLLLLFPLPSVFKTATDLLKKRLHFPNLPEVIFHTVCVTFQQWFMAWLSGCSKNCMSIISPQPLIAWNTSTLEYFLLLHIWLYFWLWVFLSCLIQR